MQPPWWFRVVALVFSLFFGVFAVRVWPVQPPEKDEAWNDGHWWKSKARYWLAYQFWFNFVGSLVGWAALWFVVPKSWPTTLPRVTWDSAVLAVVAFAGVTGHLPGAFMQLLLGIAALLQVLRNAMEKAADKLLG